jgi:hypothetical protein
MKIIFLDIDGVLNCENAFKNGECKYIGDASFHYMQFGKTQKRWINKLINETNAKIVISSTWRKSGLVFVKKVWALEKMNGDIIDTTPSLYLQDGSMRCWNDEIKQPTIDRENYNIPRGCEIDYWLKNKKFNHINWSKEKQEKIIKQSGIDNYVIIDDDSDMLYKQKDNFVHVLPSPRNKDGFGEKHYKQALKILSKSIVEQNYQ